MKTTSRAGVWRMILVCLACGPLQAAPLALPSGVSIQRFKGVPVDMATGELIQREGADLALKSRGLTLEMSRNYRSRREAAGPFGYGWSWNHAEHLEFPGDLVIHYVTPDLTLPIYPDVSYTSAYARVCLAAPGWDQGAQATGAPDATGGYGTVAHYYGPIASMQPLVAGGWGFQAPEGASTILQVDLTSIGATGYDSDHPQNGVSLKLSAGGGNSITWGHRAYDYDYVNITTDRPSWSWDDVNAVRARLELDSCRQNSTMDVVVDTFHLGVTYTRNVSGEYKYLPGTNFELVKTNHEYRILNRDLTQLAFSPEGRLLRKTDANGNSLTFHYDSLGRMAHVTDALGQSLTLRYENGLAGGRVAGVADHLGRTVGYAYDGDRLVAVTNVLGGVTRYDYDRDRPQPELSHNLIRRTDPEGFTVSCAYYTTNDAADRVWRYWDGEVTEGRSNEVDYLYLKGTTYSFMPGSGSIQGVVYNASNDISQVYIREGELTYQTSDGINLLAEHPAGVIVQARTSSWANLEHVLGTTNGFLAHHPGLASNEVLEVSGWGFSVPGLSNDIVRVSLSVRGQASQAVRLSAAGMLFTNWAATNVTWVTLDVTGDRRVWTWGDISNLTARIAPIPGATNAAAVGIDGFRLAVSYRHFDPGRDPSDTFAFHDLAHNLVSLEQDGAVHRFAYDSRGNLTAWTDPEGHTRRYEYDPVFNKPVRTWDALGNVTTLEYDARGRLIMNRDAAGRVSRLEYDPFGNLLRTTHPDGPSEVSEYDPRGVNVVRTRNRRGATTVYDYDDFGNCIRITDPLGGRRHAGYDRAGHKIRECDEAGVETRYDYDRNGRLTNTVMAAGTLEETSTQRRYDGRGLPVETVDSMGVSETLDYDDYGRLSYKTDKAGGVFLMEYDLHDHPIRRYDPLGACWETEYDGRGNPIVRQDRLGAEERFVFNRNNMQVSATDRMGNRMETVYDANGNVLRETLAPAGYPGCAESDRPEPVITAFQYDALNRVTNKTEGVGLPGVRSTATEYDLGGRVARETDPLGNFTMMAYDGDGNLTNTCLIESTGRTNSQIQFVYDPAGHKVMEIRGFGGLAATNRLEYDARGLTTAQIDALNRRTTFTYDRHRRLISVVRPDGSTRSLAYDRRGDLILEKESDGATLRHDRDAAGRVTHRVTGVGLPDARSVSCVYDLAGRLLRETDAAGGVLSRVYDDEGNVVGETNALGLVKTYSYDALGRVTNTVDEAGYSVRQVLDGRGKLCWLVDRAGGVTVSDYDAFGRLVRLTDPLGNQTSWAYDLKDRVIRETDPRGLITGYTTDAAGRVLRKMTGMGLPGCRSLQYRYDALGREVGRVHPDGSCIGQAFDPAGNLVSRTNENGAVTRFAYDSMNRLIAVVNALGGMTRTDYDARGNIIRVTDPLGNRTCTGYDAYDLKRSLTDPLGGITRYDYDRLGRLTNTTDALGGYEALAYDASGNLIARTGKTGAVSTYEHDALGRVVRIRDALGGETRKTYDAAGNVVAEIDPRGLATTYQYDALNRVIRVTDSASNSCLYAYDAGGNRIRESTPGGRVTTTGYDAFGQPVLKTVGAGRSDARRIRYAYDERGRVVREEDPLGRAIRTEYDAAGNKTNLVDRRGYSTRFDYDALNRLVCTTDAAGQSSRVDYDDAGRIVATTNRRGYSTRHEYDAAGRLVALRDAKGQVTTRSYDAVGRCCEEVGAAGLRIRFEFDADGRVTNRVAGAGTAESRSGQTGYDLLGRTQWVANAQGGITRYTHDASGNVVTVAVHGASGNLLRASSTAYNSRNLPVRRVDALGHVSRIEYDAMGRKIADVDPLGNRTEYEYNVFDEIIAVTDPMGRRSRTRYDMCGRVAETITPLGARTRHAYDPNGNRAAVMDDNGRAVLTSYDSLNRISSIDRSLPDCPYDLLQRADVNGDGAVDAGDCAALEERLP